MQFIIKDENYTDVVMSSEFGDLDKCLIVEIVRRRLNPSKIIMENNFEKSDGALIMNLIFFSLFIPFSTHRHYFGERHGALSGINWQGFLRYKSHTG